MKKYLLIMPAYNEEKNIGAVIESILLLKLPLDILVINDGSIDKTESIASNFGVEVLNLHYNSGYGAACQTGFKYALYKGYEYLIQMDSDGQHRAKDLPKFIEELEKNKADIVLGSRFLSLEEYELGALRLLAIKFFRCLIKKLTGQIITDPSSGFQGLNRSVFKFYANLDNYPEDYPDADVVIKMLLNGFKIVEIPATFEQRHDGISMHSGLSPLYYMVKMFMSIFIVVLRQKSILRRAHE